MRPSLLQFRCVPKLLILPLLCMLGTLNARADTLSGTVKDPSGAVVVGARVEISGSGLPQPIVMTSDGAGRFTAPNLTAGQYSLRVTKDGFEENVTSVELRGSADIQIQLVIQEQQVSISVSEKNLAFANSDETYQSLRGVGLGDTYYCENFVLSLDVGTFEFKSGTLTFLAPIKGFVTGAIFVGEGHFTLKPVVTMDTQELKRRSGSEVAEESFHEAVFRFSGGVYPRFSEVTRKKVDTPAAAATVFQHWKSRVRHRHESPESFTQSVLEDERIDNVDADVLTTIYNPQHPPFFSGYMVGNPHKDLRFFIRMRTGAIPQLDSPEEVALINDNPGGMDDGIWYSEHLTAELKAKTASSLEERRVFATHSYKIETVIGKNDHLASQAILTVEPLIAGERVMKIGLLPTLRVTRVIDPNGKDLHFIQEGKKQDGSFYVILDEAPPVGKEYSITIEYGGDKVLYNAGGGSYYVGARESWYPNLNGFGEKAMYDLVFKVPKSNVLISVGKLQGESTEEGFAVTHWVTPVPVAVAGFNYGKYMKADLPDPITHYNLSGYYLTELPDTLARFKNGALGSMAPGSMTKYALGQARAQMQLCTIYFGKAPYENLDLTEQPNFNFGQSWPGLVYLPISAYIDSTQRWMLFGHIDRNFTGFVQEVTPHEVAHQWFGHAVGWATYHDQWLSEGFADFSAGLFLQQAVGPKWEKDYTEYWNRQHERIVEKNSFGVSANDAGPLWLGVRLISPKSNQAYQGLTYSKGAYVLSMLRSMMYADHATSGNQEQAFIDMMHDFIESHQKMPASTESFKAIVEKHITKPMDLQQNGRMDWFFNEWVYGTHIPRYDFRYTLEPGEKNMVKVHIELTQSEVDDKFAAYVPVFADFGKGMVRIGQVLIIGNTSRKMTFIVDREPKKVAHNIYKDVLER
ncbi:MAG TPA: carboxypeptidase regulatory-like domain-containing protein [Methylomirabilota bacterium]|nr:carboxypeptidase regulatory-like domain-containing protein [Methylomirabilota bacterium]